MQRPLPSRLLPTRFELGPGGPETDNSVTSSLRSRQFQCPYPSRRFELVLNWERACTPHVQIRFSYLFVIETGTPGAATSFSNAYRNEERSVRAQIACFQLEPIWQR
jgi:hypothetical protein